MSQINGNVTAGKVFVKDANGEALCTIEDLNNLGVPTVVLDITGGVAAEDLVAALADALPTATANVSAEATNVVTVTIQIKDAQGNNLAEKCVVDFWLSDTAGGAKTADTFTGAGVAATTGVIVNEWTADTHCRCITDANGALVLTFTETGANTLYFNLVLANKYIAGSQSMVWST